MSITNNHTSFHLWRKENLVNHDCSLGFSARLKTRTISRIFVLLQPQDFWHLTTKDNYISLWKDLLWNLLFSLNFISILNVGKTPLLESFFNKVPSLQPASFFKKRLQHKCFPVKFPELLRTPILQNICKGLLPEVFYKKSILKNFEIFAGQK